jgi:hypothetical protein
MSLSARPLYPQYLEDRKLVDPRAGLDDVEKRKFLTLPGLELHELRCWHARNKLSHLINRSEYQKIFLGSRARPARKAATLPPSVSRLYRQCGILSISQPYRPPRPVTGTALL